MYLRNKVKWIFIGTEGGTQLLSIPLWGPKHSLSQMFQECFLATYGSQLGSPQELPSVEGNWLPKVTHPAGATSILWLSSAGTQRSSSPFQFWATLLGNPNSNSWDCLKPFSRLHYILTFPYCLCWFLHFLTGTVLNSPINFLQTNLHLKICFPGKQPKTAGARGDWRGNQWCAGKC